ncbi:MAG: hypothetical protein ACLRRT_09130 [Ruthenibacterium lactatiformans]
MPAQFYLFAELLNRTQSRALAEYCYPRLMQYYAFFTGQAGGSTTADLQSGLLRPWDYFYNSGGWDDYPPQKAVHEQRLEKRCTPVVTTAHAVRCARILAYTAHLLAHGEDADRLEKDAERFTRRFRSTRGTRAPDTSGMCCTMNREGLPAFAGRFRREP